jgi:hypothetical protein
MALTMTRTRTQTALTQLVETLANLKGELVFVEAWLAEPDAPAELGARRELLLQQVAALTATLQCLPPSWRSDRWCRLRGPENLVAES